MEEACQKIDKVHLNSKTNGIHGITISREIGLPDSIVICILLVRFECREEIGTQMDLLVAHLAAVNKKNKT